jgi:hypothetical protein
MTLPVEVNPLLMQPSVYQIGQSLRFRSSASAYMTWTPSATPTSFTLSMWVKRGSLGSNQALLYSRNAGSGLTCGITFTASDTIQFSANNSSAATTNAVYRDPSSWYNFVFSYDGVSTTAIYCNGVSQSFTGSNSLANAVMNVSGVNAFGRAGDAGVFYFDGYMAEINFISNQVLPASSFGQFNSTTGVWEAKKYTGTYGTNGFYLPFSNTSSVSNLGLDFSGNGNNWTPNNISLTAGSTYDWMKDSPPVYGAASGTQPKGNYAVLNPLNAGGASVSRGNLYSLTTVGGLGGPNATIGVSSGKWYWEMTSDSTSGQTYMGIRNPSADVSTYPGQNTNSYAYNQAGQKYYNNGATAYGASWTVNDVIGVAFDADAGTITFYKNGASQGVAFTGIPSNTWFPAHGDGSSGLATSDYYNFGQQPFVYTPPANHKAICSTNLPTPSIPNGAKYMAATLYTGTGAVATINNGANTTLGTTFQPDLVWLKSTSASTNNNWFDAVRGATNYLVTNTTNAQATNANSLTAFSSSGFSLGTDAGSIGVNINADAYAALQWKAGAGVTSSNTAGSITSAVCVNPTTGVAIVQWTGNGAASATIGHGLGASPQWIVAHDYANAGQNYQVYHIGMPDASYRMKFNLQDAMDVAPTVWNSTAPTSTVFSVGSSLNNAGFTYIAWCWAPISAFSVFGNYSGNSSTDGPFIYTGFRPRFILVKDRSAAGGTKWVVMNSSVNSSNVANNFISPNITSSQQTFGVGGVDFLSNGFKIRTTSTEMNASGNVMIYSAFAENPFAFALAR